MDIQNLLRIHAKRCFIHLIKLQQSYLHSEMNCWSYFDKDVTGVGCAEEEAGAWWV